MKNIALILAFYILLGSFIPRTDFSQLLHLPDLMEHYELHQLEAQALCETITFSEFLYLHFIEGDEHEHPNSQEHEQLPFQNIATTNFYVQAFSLAIPAPIINADSTSNHFFYLAYLKDYHQVVFHPPA